MQENNLHNAKKIIESLVEYYGFYTVRDFNNYLGLKEGALHVWMHRNSIPKNGEKLLISKCNGLSYSWLKTGDGEMFTGPFDNQTTMDMACGLLPAKSRKRAAVNTQDVVVAETDINARGGDGYPAQFRPVIESFEIVCKGKTTEEIDEIVKGLMRDIWTKYGG